MTETLAQALELTVLGMGMTFASIGALALGMLAMTYLTRGRKRDDVAGSKPGTERQTEGEPAAMVTPESPSAVTAAAAVAAVAVALAVEESMAAQAAAAAVAVSLATLEEAAVPSPPTDGAWNSFVRGAHLSRRARYESRRPRSL